MTTSNVEYHFKLNENELELVLIALGMLAEGSDDDADAATCRRLLARLDNEAMAQFDEVHPKGGA